MQVKSSHTRALKKGQVSTNEQKSSKSFGLATLVFYLTRAAKEYKTDIFLILQKLAHMIIILSSVKYEFSSSDDIYSDNSNEEGKISFILEKTKQRKQ